MNVGCSIRVYNISFAILALNPCTPLLQQGIRGIRSARDNFYRHLENPKILRTACRMEEIALITQQHVNHDKRWIVPGYCLPKLCIACVIFRLEKKAETDICCKKILDELLAILSSGNGQAFSTLRSDSRVLQHLANILFGEQH